jgi:RNA polymerase sigma-70 factor (ECF subfamily)
MDAEPDAQLVREIAGNGAQRAAAEAALCRRFAPRIRLYGLRHLRDEERARDLVQHVLCALLPALRAGKVAEPDKLDRYVLGTCRNSAQRMRGQDARAEPLPHDALAELMNDAELGAALDARDAPAISSLVQCFDALEIRAKQVVQLSFQAERSAEEIAAELALTAGNVRVLRHRAIAALRRCLDQRTEAGA